MTSTTPTHRPPRGVAAIRDANESPFAAILEQLLRGLPGAYASAFVDDEGECVEYAGAVDAFHVKVAAAHFRVALEALNETRAAGRASWFLVRGTKESALVYRLADLYALVVLFSRGGGFARTPRALAAALRQISEEGGFAYQGERWYPARFTLDANHRPTVWHCQSSGLGTGIRAREASPAVRAERVEVVGSVMGLGRGERGYRLRLETGAEVTAVQEVSRVWYTDDQFAASSASANTAKHGT